MVFLPIVLFYTQPGFVKFRLVPLFLLSVYAWVFARTEHLTWRDFGVSKRNFSAAFTAILPWTMISMVFATGLLITFPSIFDVQELGREFPLLTPVLLLLSYVFISIPIQEFLFRGVYIPRLEKLPFGSQFAILWSSIVFGYSHTIFVNKWFALGAFVFGLPLAINFAKNRNIWALILSHALLGATFVGSLLYLR
jgi:membrane protease YdiL (CAAX protease family)